MNQHNHNHHQAVAHAGKQQSSSIYAVPFFLILVFAFIEFFGGVWTNSLALISDSWHMFSDLFALGFAWLAAHLSAKPNTHRHASGQSHLEIAASVVNVILMFGVVFYIIIEAIQRYNQPQPIAGIYVIFIALVGLVVNLIVLKMLHGGHNDHGHSAQNHNKRAAYLHVLGDLLGSAAAVLAGVIIFFTGWLKIDPILSLFISLLILVVTIKLSKDIWVSYKNG